MYHLQASIALRDYMINENEAARSLRGINQLCSLQLIQPNVLGTSLLKLMQKNLNECTNTRIHYENYYLPELGEAYIEKLKSEIYTDKECKLEAINFFLQYIESSEIRITST